MKIGLIGGGYWGKNLIRDFNTLGNLEMICDLNEEVLKNYNEKYPGVKTTKKWNDVLENKEITAVCIALPAELHYKFARQSLMADKDVYVEKPITLDVAEAKELVKIAKERNKILMVGHLLHYHPYVERMKELKREIGKIKYITANRMSMGIFRENENVLWSFAPHDISVVLSLCGDEMPKEVICNGRDILTSGIEDIMNVVLKYEDKYVNINVNWLSPVKEQKMTVVGEKGAIVFDDVAKELVLFPEYRTEDGKPIKNNGIKQEIEMDKSPLLRECEHFIECCEERKRPITDGEEGIRVLEVLQRCSPVAYVRQKYFKHETAIVDDGADIGEGTKIWHYSHICAGAKIGKNCNIGQNVYIAGGAVIGNNCKVQNNVSIYAGVEAEDYVFFGPSCVLTNDINPRGMHSKNGKYMKTILKKGVTLGANSTIVCGNTIGEHALIGAGAVICKDVEPNSVMVGNPGRKIGFIDEKGERN